MKNLQEIKNALKSALSVKEGVHATSRALFLVSIANLVMDFINDAYDGRQHIFRMESLIEDFKRHATPFNTERLRYRYRGAERGSKELFFSFSDDYGFSMRKEDGSMEMLSISEYDLPHFLCDRFDTEEECDRLVDWICSSTDRVERVAKCVCGNRLSPLWMSLTDVGD